MDPGPRSVEVAAPWRRATWVWMLITLVAALHDYARDLWLAPALGFSGSRWVGALTLSVIILVLAGLTGRWIAARRWLHIGVFWLSLTLAFELALALANSHDGLRVLVSRLTSPWIVVLGMMLIAPSLAAKLRRLP